MELFHTTFFFILLLLTGLFVVLLSTLVKKVSRLRNCDNALITNNIGLFSGLAFVTPRNGSIGFECLKDINDDCNDLGNDCS